jgi:hypothetical protein
MTVQKYRRASSSKERSSESIFEELPPEAKQWAESLPWDQRRHVLLLCHLICVSTPEKQAEFLDTYTADGLISRKFQDRDTQRRVKEYLQWFSIKTELNDLDLRNYIKQFYIHSTHHTTKGPELYLKSIFQLVLSTEEQNNIFNYILGFELLKLLFQMSWLQHERLYQLQKNQEDFIKKYIRPIQIAHKANKIVVPEGKEKFFAKRDFFIKKPNIRQKKLIELVMATFTTDVMIHLGFSIIRDQNFLVFDYEYIFQPEPQGMFPE